MKNIQRNRLTRNKRVKLSVNDPVIAPTLLTITEFPALNTSLGNQIAKVELLDQKQATLLKLLYANRMTGRINTIFVCLQLGAPLLALGIKTKNNELILAGSITKTSLRKLTHAELAAKALAMLALAVAHTPELAIYLITPAVLDNMETTINNFVEALDAADGGRDQQKQVTADIELTLDESDAVVLRMAHIFETLKEAFPESYTIFRNACRVIYTGGSTISANGVVVDADTGEAIKRCRLRITSFEPLVAPMPEGGETEGKAHKATPSYTDLMKSVKFTSPNGVFRFKNLANGTYRITAYRSGYADTTVTFYVNNGEVAEVNIRLQKVVTEAA